jgi:hypothetical protein
MLRLVVVFLVFASASLAAGQPATRSQCFPVEQLDAANRAKAQTLFLKILDSEGLYTIAGGSKPMSSSFVMFYVDTGNADPNEVDETRRLLDLFRCGDAVFATVQHFRATQENPTTGKTERPYEGVVFALPALREAISARWSFFRSIGLSPWSHPMEVLTAIEYSDRGTRWRGYGHLYGYPDDAVTFFVEAGLSQDRDGRFVQRQFISHPTFSREDRGVVYAVSVDHEPDATDAAFRDRLRRALADYRIRREKYIGDAKPGVIELLRDWFCRTDDLCTLPVAP